MKRLLLFGFIALLPGTAETLPRLSFSKLLEDSSAVVHGRVVRHWTAWDANHEFIWTHYELRPTEILRGRRVGSYTISEPGGIIGEIGLNVSGSVPFTDGEEVVAFLHQVPNGFLRVTGGTQGKLLVVNTVAGKSVSGAPHLLRSTDMEHLKSAIRSELRQEAK
jgi:hypothetical protein